MKKVGIILVCLLCLVSCEEKEREPEVVLKNALEALNREDYDAYLQRVDWGVEMDSTQTLYMKQALRQHVGWRCSERAAVVAIDVQDVKMQGDSVCTVYYQYTFADGTNEVSSQKMVRYGEDWKLRLRN
ncbi:MAG: hypothetical protein J6T38_04835 [Bacteroidaceae bacterium]|nr:hypothetical protein [Bacteroidaceae bacterium]